MGRTYKQERGWEKPRKKNKRNAKQGNKKRSLPKHTNRPDEDYNYQESFERFDKKR